MKVKSLVAVGMCLISYQLKSQNVALNFDGADDYVSTTHTGIGGASSRTVEAWIRTTANADPNNGGKQIVITDWGTAVTGGRFTFNVLFNNAIRIEVNGSGMGGTIAVNDGNWHHVAVVYDSGAAKPYRLYVDGKLDVAGTVSTSISTTKYTTMLIGKRVDNINFFNGDIDEVRVYNYARTDSMVNADKGREYCKIPKGLVAYYKLNEGTASGTNSSKTTAVDYSGFGQNGALNNFALKNATSNWISGPSLSGAASITNINAFACAQYTIPSGKRTYFSSGTYKDTLQNANGCDSVLIIKLTIGKSSRTLNVSACNSYKSNSGQMYSATGSYTEKFTSSKGCDSTVIYNVTIYKSVIDTVAVSGCDSFESNQGFIYYKSGYFTEFLTGFRGCDSTVVYDLTIHNALQTIDTSTVCDGAWIDGLFYSSSQKITKKYTSVYGCDSVHTTELIVNPTKNTYQKHTVCDSFYSDAGQLYAVSGNYTENFKTYLGCDSIVHLELTINHAATFRDTVTNCRPVYVNGIKYVSSQIVNYKIKTVNGCDSFVTIDLRITNNDKTITQSGKTLTANATGAAYRWLNCTNYLPVSGATQAVFTPAVNGSYAVEIIKDGCTDTSACYTVSGVGILNLKNNRFVAVFPNPNSGNFSIQKSPDVNIYSVTIMDVSGKELFTTNFPVTTEINTGHLLKDGIYFVKLNADIGFETIKMTIAR